MPIKGEAFVDKLFATNLYSEIQAKLYTKPSPHLGCLCLLQDTQFFLQAGECLPEKPEFLISSVSCYSNITHSMVVYEHAEG